MSEPEELASFYVDRGSEVRSHFSLLLKASDLRQKTPIKLLFTGHKGSGKPTEMNKLFHELKDQFFIVKVQTGQRPDVNYIDVLLKGAMALLKAANDHEIINRALTQKASDLWDTISVFLSGSSLAMCNRSATVRTRRWSPMTKRSSSSPKSGSNSAKPTCV